MDNINEVFSKWECEKCEKTCEVECVGIEKPLVCIFNKEVWLWKKCRLIDDKTILTVDEIRFEIRDCRDVNAVTYYDLYVDGLYEGSYVTRKEAKGKIKELSEKY